VRLLLLLLPATTHDCWEGREHVVDACTIVQSSVRCNCTSVACCLSGKLDWHAHHMQLLQCMHKVAREMHYLASSAGPTASAVH
jgi:hypothetical protein